MRSKYKMIVAAALALSLAAPASAQQYSDGYTFLKAVRDDDGTKAQSMIEAPGSVVLNYRDPSSGDAAIHEVVKKRDMRWLSYFLARGQRPDYPSARGDTPLTLAAQIGWLEGAQALLDRKANVNAPDGSGQTPIILAVQNRNMQMVQLLLDAGANPKIGDRLAGLNALDYARRDSRSAAILRLLEQPAKKPKEIVGPKF